MEVKNAGPPVHAAKNKGGRPFGALTKVRRDLCDDDGLRRFGVGSARQPVAAAAKKHRAALWVADWPELVRSAELAHHPAGDISGG